MKVDIKTIIIVALAFFLIWGNLGKWLGFDNDGVRESTETTTKIEVRVDTVEKVIEKIVVNQPIFTNTTREVTVPYIPPPDQENAVRSEINADSIKIKLPINRYQDTLDVDGATLAYDHTVAGYLEGSKYRIRFPKETITVTDSIFMTKTQIKNRVFDFFLVAGYELRPTPEYEIGVDFVTKKWKVGAVTGYDPIIKENFIKVNAGIRLFGQ